MHAFVWNLPQDFWHRTQAAIPVSHTLEPPGQPMKGEEGAGWLQLEAEVWWCQWWLCVQPAYCPGKLWLCCVWDPTSCLIETSESWEGSVTRKMLFPPTKEGPWILRQTPAGTWVSWTVVLWPPVPHFLHLWGDLVIAGVFGSHGLPCSFLLDVSIL